MAINYYTAGTRLTLSLDFQDEDDTYVDPDTVTGYVRRADGIVEEFVYGTDSEITKTATGKYTLLYLIPIGTKSGLFTYNGYGSGTYDITGTDKHFGVLDWSFA